MALTGTVAAVVTAVVVARAGDGRGSGGVVAMVVAKGVMPPRTTSKTFVSRSPSSFAPTPELRMVTSYEMGMATAKRRWAEGTI